MPGKNLLGDCEAHLEADIDIQSITVSGSVSGSGDRDGVSDQPDSNDPCTYFLSNSASGSFSVTFIRIPYEPLLEYGELEFSLYKQGCCNRCGYVISPNTIVGDHLGTISVNSSCSNPNGCVWEFPEDTRDSCLGWPKNYTSDFAVDVDLQFSESGGICMVSLRVGVLARSVSAFAPHDETGGVAYFVETDPMPISEIFGTHSFSFVDIWTHTNEEHTYTLEFTATVA